MNDIKLWVECTLGDKSHLNLLGKIVFSPLILLTAGIWFICEILFSKSTNE